MACAATLAWPVPHLFIPEPRTLTVSEVSDPALGQLEMGTGPDAQGLWASAHSLGLPPAQRDQWKLCTCEASRDGSAAHYSHGRPSPQTLGRPAYYGIPEIRAVWSQRDLGLRPGSSCEEAGVSSQNVPKDSILKLSPHLGGCGRS